MTRTATPRRPSTGCTGFLQTIADDVSHGGNVFGVISARYTDKGGPGGVPPLTRSARCRSARSNQEVEHVVTQSGTNTATNTDVGGGHASRQPGAGDWIRLNGPFNLHQIDSITFRVADTAAGRTAGLAAGGGRAPHGLASPGRSWPRTTWSSTGGTAVWTTPDVPDLAGREERAVPRVPRGHGRPTGSNLFNLNWVEFGGNGVTVVRRHRATGTVGGTVPATLSLSLGTPASFGPFTPGVARTYDARTTANVISTAGDATLSVADPSSTATGPPGQRRVLAARSR